MVNLKQSGFYTHFRLSNSLNKADNFLDLDARVSEEIDVIHLSCGCFTFLLNTPLDLCVCRVILVVNIGELDQRYSRLEDLEVKLLKEG